MMIRPKAQALYHVPTKYLFLPNLEAQSLEIPFLSYFFVKKYLLVGASGMLWAGGSVSGSVVQWISGSVDQ